jgi:hypothetical protein
MPFEPNLLACFNKSIIEKILPIKPLKLLLHFIKKRLGRLSFSFVFPVGYVNGVIKIISPVIYLCKEVTLVLWF